ncbi:phosphatidylinositol-glycan biosynthesis class F protein [Culicoides brevitarsis]|uniref:phosphatidylinositol-glycan biosynthesis class F protein n=1 Tax=Culicoides brevitarsis TaxID=469753 RepID=UPI00307B246B
MSTQYLWPQFVCLTISLATTALGVFIGQTKNFQNVFYFVFPATLGVEIVKFFIIQKCFQIPGNAFPNATGKHNNYGTLSFIKDLLKTVTIFLFAIIVVAFALGATNLEATIYFSLILTCISLLPIQLFVGPRCAVLVMLSSKLELGKLIAEQHLDFLQYAAIGAILGSWGSSIAMPLDWDRPYQTYPIPQVVGAIGGHLLGCVFFVLRTMLINAKNEIKKKSIL